LLADILASKGYQVATASGKRASRSGFGEADLVLLDVMMPDLNG
jgi:DNA-binding response OmpR family regulator